MELGSKHPAGSYILRVCTPDKIFCAEQQFILGPHFDKQNVFDANLFSTAVQYTGGDELSSDHGYIFSLANLLNISRHARLAEIACGTLDLTEKLLPFLESVSQYSCFEAESWLMKVGLQARPDVSSFIHGHTNVLQKTDVFSRVDREAKFDVVVSREFLQHLPRWALQRGLNEVAALLQEGGKALLAANLAPTIADTAQVDGNLVPTPIADTAQGDGTVPALRRTQYTALSKCDVCSAAAGAGLGCTAVDLNGMFVAADGLASRFTWLMLEKPSAPSVPLAPTESWERVDDADISYGEHCCVYDNGSDDPLQTATSDSGDGRCWYGSFDEARTVCAMFDSCFGIVKDNAGFEPRRGPAPIVRCGRAGRL